MFVLQRLGPKVLRTTSFQNQIAPSVYNKNTCFRNIGEIKLNLRRPQTLQCTSSALIDRFALTVTLAKTDLLPPGSNNTRPTGAFQPRRD